MTKAQWKAVYDFCKEFGYTKAELLCELRANGTLSWSEKLEDLSAYVQKDGYDAMINFLGDNV